MSPGLERVLRFHNTQSTISDSDITDKRKRAALAQAELLDIFELLYARRIGFDRQMLEFQALERIGNVSISVLAPPVRAWNGYVRLLERAIVSRHHRRLSRSSANKTSLVLHLEYGGHRVLLGGDAVDETWRAVLSGAKKRGPLSRYFPVDVVKVSHHGAGDSYSAGMWPIVAGAHSVAVVSAEGSRHPSAALIREVQDVADLYCTNRGSCCAGIAGAERGAGPDDVTEPGFPVDAEGQKCFGWIEVTIPEHASPTVRTERRPVQHALPCRVGPHRARESRRVGGERV
jgi:hypothetical protein